MLRLLGVEGNQGAELGLSADWAYNIIKSVGNYGEIFERNIGVNTPIGLARGSQRAVDRWRAPVLAAVPLSAT